MDSQQKTVTKINATLCNCPPLSQPFPFLLICVLDAARCVGVRSSRSDELDLKSSHGGDR